MTAWPGSLMAALGASGAALVGLPLLLRDESRGSGSRASLKS